MGSVKNIQNMPKAFDQFIVYMNIDGDLWFHSSWPTQQQAIDVAINVGRERDVETGVEDTKNWY